MSIRSLTLCPSFATAALLFFGLLPVLHAQTYVEVISTALGHVSVVQVPEPVENVALGSSQVHVEWHDRSILIEPEKPGVDTNIHVRRGNHAEFDSVPLWMPTLKVAKSDSVALNLQISGGEIAQPGAGTAKRRQSNGKR